VINLGHKCVDIEWSEAKRSTCPNTIEERKFNQSVCPKYGHQVKKMKCMWKWKKKHTMPLEIGLAKDMKKCIKNNKKCMSSQKDIVFPSHKRF
jgi:hypothetical protein